jgi:hypothetical protein
MRPDGVTSWRWIRLAIAISGLTCAASIGRDLNGQTEPAPACTWKDRFFEDDVWAKVAERTCLRCHNRKGDAAESGFVLSPRSPDRDHDVTWIQRNCDTFQTMAKSKQGDQSRLLLKAIGGLDHGGGQVLKPDSTGYRLLERFVKRLNPPSKDPAPAESKSDYNSPPFFDGIAMISPQRLLRRVTLSLAGRLPTAEERAAVEADPKRGF